MRLAAWIVGGVSVAFVATWAGLYIWNEGRKDDFVLERIALEDPDAPDREARLTANNELMNSIDSSEIIAWTMLGMGGFTLAISTILFLASRGRSVVEEEPAVSVLPSLRGVSISARW